MRSDYFTDEGSMKLLKGTLGNTVIQSEQGVRWRWEPPLLRMPGLSSL